MLITNRKIYFLITAIIILSQIFLLNGCSEKIPLDKKVKFIVRLKDKSFNYNLYLSGNDTILGNWHAKAVPMDKISDSEWVKTISFREGEKIEFKANSGSWWAEPLDSSQNLYGNFSLKINNDTNIIINVFGWSNKLVNGIPVFYPKRFLPQRNQLVIDDLWKYHAGDNPDWKNLNFNDSQWIQTDSYLNWTKVTDPQWENTGWFRFHFYADSSIWNKTLAISIAQIGASEVYYNGKLLFSFGVCFLRIERRQACPQLVGQQLHGSRWPRKSSWPLQTSEAVFS